MGGGGAQEHARVPRVSSERPPKRGAPGDPINTIFGVYKHVLFVHLYEIRTFGTNHVLRGTRDPGLWGPGEHFKGILGVLGSGALPKTTQRAPLWVSTYWIMCLSGGIRRKVLIPRTSCGRLVHSEWHRDALSIWFLYETPMNAFHGCNTISTLAGARGCIMGSHPIMCHPREYVAYV